MEVSSGQITRGINVLHESSLNWTCHHSWYAVEEVSLFRWLKGGTPLNMGQSAWRIWRSCPCGRDRWATWMNSNYCCGDTAINTLRPRQDGRHYADDILKCIFLNENVWTPIKISLKFVPKSLIDNIPALVQIMAWRRPGDKPLSEPMMVNLHMVYIYIYIYHITHYVIWYIYIHIYTA